MASMSPQRIGIRSTWASLRSSDMASFYNPGMARESMQYDVVIVGGGPAGLAAAIRLKQLAAQAGRELGVCVLEKGSEIGAHILSGAVVDPKALDELIPDWKDKGSPLTVPVTQNHHWVLGKSSKWEFPHFLLP